QAARGTARGTHPSRRSAHGQEERGTREDLHLDQREFRSRLCGADRGGEAELALENPEKPFEGGLTLKVKPAHKKALRLEALSGGERSLASMALIFAIQEYDPSPFYLLDEIDQNLDAVNAEKVARMIRRNSATAQFVQISLRKVSLKEADHLVGVTMTPESLSEVIMRVNLADVEDEKPTEVIPA